MKKKKVDLFSAPAPVCDVSAIEEKRSSGIRNYFPTEDNVTSVDGKANCEDVCRANVEQKAETKSLSPAYSKKKEKKNMCLFFVGSNPFRTLRTSQNKINQTKLCVSFL